MTYHLQKRRGYSHVTVLKLAVCSDAARRAGLSATAEVFVNFGGHSDISGMAEVRVVKLCTQIGNVKC